MIVVLTTHDLDVVEGLLDSGVVLRDGRLVACERPSRRLRERYARALARERVA